MLNLPNKLTILRVCLIPLFIFFYSMFMMTNAIVYVVLALFTALFSEFTDVADGYIARKYNMVTNFGKLIDPMADCLSRLTVYFCLTAYPVGVPFQLVMVMLYRDVMIAYLRSLCALSGYALAARTSGKAKAFIQGVGAMSILIVLTLNQTGYTSIDVTTYATWVTSIAALASFISAVDYIGSNRNTVKKLITSQA
ncbi:CDP-diacylglycerol--glycerol-3-phosphate 3-phosphatidyltransferase [Chlamydiia bacterium]|nr:CDP-diacylglycerol--glycerol-3-phosphate 3-phosphatidyltransferase [Chlamydiia bacterium]